MRIMMNEERTFNQLLEKNQEKLPHLVKTLSEELELLEQEDLYWNNSEQETIAAEKTEEYVILREDHSDVQPGVSKL